MKIASRPGSWAALLVLAAPGALLGQEQQESSQEAAQETAQLREARRIEELVVTAERREATVSDTSIAITSLDGQMIEGLGLTGADDMIEFLPATTRDEFDIRIRGVGRNFRALGGDPGVATYYNGVYSEDFNVAASEGNLYDIARIEVLRGPQGTLYGRNSIGGAINYEVNEPTFDWTGELRTRLGRWNTNEYYGFISGPLNDRLAVRLTGVKLFRDPRQDGLGESKDLGSVNDQNLAAQLLLEPMPELSFKVRVNDRQVKNRSQQGLLLNEGAVGERGERNTEDFVFGFREVAEGTPGALAFTHPETGETRFGAKLRPGVDSRTFPHMPAGSFNDPLARLNNPDNPTDKRDLNFHAITNVDPQSEAYRLRFDHRALQSSAEWNPNANLTLRYILGLSDFTFIATPETNHASRPFSDARTFVEEDVQTWSQELQVLWDIGERFQATSGAYVFQSDRRQNFAIQNPTAQGRITEPVDYGFMQGFIDAVVGDTPHQGLFDAAEFTSTLGPWGGNDGNAFEHWNTTDTRAYALFTQGTYHFSDEWALTLGVRWARDEKQAHEQRALYFEAPVGEGGFMDFLLDDGPAGPEGPNWLTFVTGLFEPGVQVTRESDVTPLAAVNFLMGNAQLTGDPESPIAPVCELDADECANPLRLGGVPFSNATNTRDDDSWSRWTWRANLDWTPDDDTLIYLSATTGYRAGGYSLGVADARPSPENGQLGAPFSYDAERVFAVELGYKAMFLDRRLMLNTAVYNYRYTNYQDQVQFFDAALQQSNNIVVNVPRARNTGVELETTWLPTDRLTLSANYSYTNTEYRSDFFVADFTDPSLPAPVFGGVEENEALFVHNLKGNSLKQIPEHKGSVWGSYDWDFDWGSLRSTLSWSYTGSFFSEGLEVSRYKVPHRHRLDGSVTWFSPSRHLRVRGFVENILDDINMTNINNSTHNGNFQQTTSSTGMAPRFFGVDIRWDFMM